MKCLRLTALSTVVFGMCVLAFDQAPAPSTLFTFDGTTSSEISGPVSYVDGLDDQALSLSGRSASSHLTLEARNLQLTKTDDFSVQYWIRTTVDSDKRIVLLSTKPFTDNSLASQKEAGWVFYLSGGTWGWNIGSGTRRLTYERDNGRLMPMNDGKWHQLTMTYDSALSEVRLFYDGANKTVYHVDDATGFDFTNTNPITIGWAGAAPALGAEVLPAIEAGASTLQALVNEFNRLGATPVTSEEFVHLIVDPKRLFDRNVKAMAEKMGAGAAAFEESMASADFGRVTALESELMKNPYTVHQVIDFMDTAPLMKVFALVEGTVTIRERGASAFAARERLDAPEFDMDNLAFWDRPLSSEEIRSSYAAHFAPAASALDESVTSLTAASWNIWHGGKHFTTEEHGWDSRVAIANMIRDEGVDVVMMQETYSAGDFIAAELGYYFATTVDWDYLNQGANISVLSRYPIKELSVPAGSAFMNVAVTLAISKTQDLYAMSNWYGMDQFPAVFEFHEARFQQSATTPTLFAGDFNAVPHTDGGDSPASRALLDAGFTDAFRQTFPDVQTDPGPTHQNNRRIDQLYFKGARLSHISTKQVSTRPAGFPSDHFMIVSRFGLK